MAIQWTEALATGVETIEDSSEFLLDTSRNFSSGIKYRHKHRAEVQIDVDKFMGIK